MCCWLSYSEIVIYINGYNNVNNVLHLFHLQFIVVKSLVHCMLLLTTKKDDVAHNSFLDYQSQMYTKYTSALITSWEDCVIRLMHCPNTMNQLICWWLMIKKIYTITRNHKNVTRKGNRFPTIYSIFVSWCPIADLISLVWTSIFIA